MKKDSKSKINFRKSDMAEEKKTAERMQSRRPKRSAGQSDISRSELFPDHPDRFREPDEMVRKTK